MLVLVCSRFVFLWLVSRYREELGVCLGFDSLVRRLARRCLDIECRLDNGGGLGV